MSTLRSIRQANGESLEHAAARIGVNPTHLSRIERGQVAPSLPLFQRIARAYGLRRLASMVEPFTRGSANAA